MPLSLEQTMIKEARGNIDSSQRKTDRHAELIAQRKYFSLEALHLRWRDEESAATKRHCLGVLIEALTISHNVHTDDGKELKQSDSSARKTKRDIVDEINLQISQLHGIQVILNDNRMRMQATMGLFASSAEGMAVIDTCENLLEAAIKSWILQLEDDKHHQNGIFSQKFTDSETQTAGELFEGYVRRLITRGEQIERRKVHDPRVVKQNEPAIQLDPRASGVWQPTSLTGAAPVGAAKIMISIGVQTDTQVETDLDKGSSSTEGMAFSGVKFLPPSAPPPDYYFEPIVPGSQKDVNQAAAALASGQWDPQKSERPSSPSRL